MSDVALVELTHEGQFSGDDIRTKDVTFVAGERELRNSTENLDGGIVQQPPESLPLYLYYADRSRDSPQGDDRTQVADRHNGTSTPGQATMESSKSPDHSAEAYGVSKAEQDQAARAMKTATWMGAFFLLTTDVLGPYSVPFAIAQLGYGTGIILFTIMMLCAAYSGWILWRLFLKLDSPEFPVTNYGDLAYKIFGNAARIGCSSLQALQLWFNVGVIILVNAQALSQVSSGKVCFSVLALIWAIVGMVMGQIKTLQRFRMLANLSIWLNLTCLAIIMAIVVRSAPNYATALAQYGEDVVNIASPAPVSVPAFSSGAVNTQIVAVMQIVYSYGGATIFVELMAEMRRPFDFWKALMLSQLAIYVCYLIFGIFVAHYQGQYAINPASQGLSPYAWQTAANVLNLLASIIAAVLYGNVGLKVLYSLLIQKALKGPPLTSPRSRIWWSLLIPAYWALAFILASAIPQFNNISALVAAVCILQFSYTFPPLLMFAFEVQQDATRIERFNEWTGTVERVDSWSDWSRWKRGIGRRWYVKTFNLILFLASASLAGLGMWAAISSLRETFAANKTVTSFACKAPV